MDRPTLPRSQRGLSLVELMVATVISLIGVIVIFQVFAVNEGVRRSTTGGSDEQTSGLLSLMLMERELRHAGYGINAGFGNLTESGKVNDLDMLGCVMRVYDTFRTPHEVPDFFLTPVEIVSNAGAVPDVIRITYGSVTQTTVASTLQGMESATADIALKPRFGYNSGDKVIIGQAVVKNETPVPCSMREVTDAPKGTNTIAHGVSGYTNSVTKQSATPRFNRPAGTQAVYPSERAKVLSLGQNPVRLEVTVRNDEADPSKNNQLVAQNLFSQMTQPTQVGEQVVQLKAEYGMDDGKDNGTIVRGAYVADDNIVDNYTTASPDEDNPWDWQRIRSVRLAIVTRSQVAERATDGTCNATLDWDTDAYPVVWARGPGAPKGKPIDVRTTGDDTWRCYRYKVYETTVPLRNMLWRQANS